MTPMTPAQVLERRRELLLNQDTDGFVDLFAPDGAIELPFAGPDLPPRLDGQQAIRDFSNRAAASPLRIEDLETVALHHTSDPEVVIVELLSRVTVAATVSLGAPLRPGGTSIRVRFTVTEGPAIRRRVQWALGDRITSLNGPLVSTP